MAISKIHSIRGTLSKAIKYITNPKKTEDELYVSTFGCSKETITQEFNFTRNQGSGIGNTLAQHVIQSFKPGEVSPEEAHQIGMELAKKLTAGKHEFIVTTHTDKGHVHNHIIFNQVDFVNHKKFRSNIKTTKILREMNDEICAAHNLSIISDPKEHGSSHYEWTMNKQNKSYRRMLKTNIDLCIQSSKNYDEFLSHMKSIGYEIRTGKYISFRKNEQERFIRSKSLGEDYTEERLIERINNPSSESGRRSIADISPSAEIGLIESLSNLMNQEKSPYYVRKASLKNAKALAKTYSYLKKNGINSFEDLDAMISSLYSNFKKKRNILKNNEDKISVMNEIIKFSERFKTYQSVWNEYLSSDKSDDFRNCHISELMLYESALKSLKHYSVNPKTLDLDLLRKKLYSLEEQNAELSSEVEMLNKKYRDISQVKRNIETLFHETPDPVEKEKDIDRSR